MEDLAKEDEHWTPTCPFPVAKPRLQKPHALPVSERSLLPLSKRIIGVEKRKFNLDEDANRSLHATVDRCAALGHTSGAPEVAPPAAPLFPPSGRSRDRTRFSRSLVNFPPTCPSPSELPPPPLIRGGSSSSESSYQWSPYKSPTPPVYTPCTFAMEGYAYSTDFKRFSDRHIAAAEGHYNWESICADGHERYSTCIIPSYSDVFTSGRQLKIHWNIEMGGDPISFLLEMEVYLRLRGYT